MPTTYRVPGRVLTEREHRSRSTTTTRTARRSPSSPARSPHPTAATARTSCSSRAAPASRRRGRPARRPAGRSARSRTTGSCSSTSAAPAARRRSAARSPAPPPQEQAAYLTHFRADSIVRDCELIRQELGVERWSILGQSFGGFMLDDLPLVRAGGAARGADHRRPVADRPAGRRHLRRDVAPRHRQRTGATSRAIPDDRAAGQRHPRPPRRRGRPAAVRRPADRRAASASSASSSATAPASSSSTTSSSCRSARGRSCTTSEAGVRFARNPIYATLHESSYADGVPTRWSADRLHARRDRRAEGYFTAEHVFPWMWEDYGGLQPHREAAEILAEHPWPRLYDADALAPQRGPRRGDDLRQRPVRRARLRRGDGGAHPGPAHVGHRRVRAQRPARRRRARPRPADRHGPRGSLIAARPPSEAGARAAAKVSPRAEP